MQIPLPDRLQHTSDGYARALLIASTRRRTGTPEPRDDLDEIMNVITYHKRNLILIILEDSTWFKEAVTRIPTHSPVTLLEVDSAINQRPFLVHLEDVSENGDFTFDGKTYHIIENSSRKKTREMFNLRLLKNGGMGRGSCISVRTIQKKNP